MPPPPPPAVRMDTVNPDIKKIADGTSLTSGGDRLGTIPGVYIPVCLNILSILMFLRFGVILGRVGFVGIVGLLVVAYSIDFLTLFSLSAIASNGEVKGGGAYYLISRSLGPEFGGSIGILFYLASVLNSALNVVGLIDCIRLNVGERFPQGYWVGYGLQTAALVACTGLCFLGSAKFSKASNVLLVILSIAVASIPASAIFKAPFIDRDTGIEFTGISLETLADNFMPHTSSPSYSGAETFRELFGILFPATAGILAGASLSGDLKSPSKAIPKGTLWATLTTFIVYFIVILSMAASTTRASLLNHANIIPLTNLSQLVIFAGECATTAFSALIGIKTSAGLFRALSKDKLLPGLFVFDKGSGSRDLPIAALAVTYGIAQVAMLADLNQIATLISMGFQMTFFVMNLACFFLKIGSAPNFRPGFKFFNWQTAFLGSLLSAVAMFFIDQTYAALAICTLIFLFLLIHYLCPPKRWGDVSQNLIYHQVRKYLLRLKPEHIKFWRPHIILLINNPRRQTRLIKFCNSLKKGSLYILGHVIVTDDFGMGVQEARVQQQAWSNYISESSKIKAFVQLTMSPSITWGVRNLILSSGLGGMRPNIAILGFYNMSELRESNPHYMVPEVPASPAMKMSRPPPRTAKRPGRRRGDTSARLLEGFLPTDVIRTEGMMKPGEYMTILEDLALRHRMNVAVGYGFDKFESPRKDDPKKKKFVDLWPIQMSAEVTTDGRNVLTTNFDTYTLILQLGHILQSIKTWKATYQLRVMVFVEYENEVEEEGARVRLLLEKLRIDAKVIVFWLSSGKLNTYELIINGKRNDIDWEIITNDALRDEAWWEDLQVFRGQSGQSSAVPDRSELTQILGSSSGRQGSYNPHDDMVADRRRPGANDVGDIPRRPAISVLSKLGVNMGMHTQHLGETVLEGSDTEARTDGFSETSSDEEEDLEQDSRPDDATREFESAGLRLPSDPVNLPLLAESREGIRLENPPPKHRRRSERARDRKKPPTYGTMSTAQTLLDREDQEYITWSESSNIPRLVELGASPSPEVHGVPMKQEPEPFPLTTPLSVAADASSSRRARSVSPSKQAPRDSDGGSTSVRPGMSRQSSAMRFSSRPVPETTITAEGDDSRISFALTPSGMNSPVMERPSASRQSSFGNVRAPVRPRAESRPSGGPEGKRGISFAEPPATTDAVGNRSASHSRHHSRQSSASTYGDLSLSLANLLESYRTEGGLEGGLDGAGSIYSTQSISLSFNDLPSRAQHLVLNELMRSNSADTALVLTTLPVPAEDTSLDEQDTISYLSDVEVLCNELPPTLMVLSNSMTVTVGL